MRGAHIAVCLLVSVCKARSPQVHTIAIHNFHFEPETVTVEVGDKIEWKNEDIVPHTVTADDKSFASGSIRPKRSWTFVPRKPGLFSYSCTPHPNMKGLLVVKAPRKK